jgi:hypothetical protein
MAKTVWNGWLKEVPKNRTLGGIIYGANLRKASDASSTKLKGEAVVEDEQPSQEEREQQASQSTTDKKAR